MALLKVPAPGCHRPLKRWFKIWRQKWATFMRPWECQAMANIQLILKLNKPQITKQFRITHCSQLLKRNCETSDFWHTTVLLSCSACRAKTQNPLTRLVIFLPNTLFPVIIQTGAFLQVLQSLNVFNKIPEKTLYYSLEQKVSGSET